MVIEQGKFIYFLLIIRIKCLAGRTGRASRASRASRARPVRPARPARPAKPARLKDWHDNCFAVITISLNLQTVKRK